jgi:hypothetical protein
VAFSLAIRSKRIADQEHINEEANTLRMALLQNGFPNRLFHKAWNHKVANSKEENEEVWKETVYLPYIKNTTDKISQLLRHEQINTVFQTHSKIGEMLRPFKDKIPLEGWGVYEIPCGECASTYVGQTGRNFSMRKEEHMLAIKNNTKTSALAQHARDFNHIIDFEHMKPLAIVNHLTTRITREAIEIERRPNNLNKRDDSQRLPAAWSPIIKTIEVPPKSPPSTRRAELKNQPKRTDKRRKIVPMSTSPKKPKTPSPTTRITRSRAKKFPI